MSLAQSAVIACWGCGSSEWVRDATDEVVAEIERLINAKLDERKWGSIGVNDKCRA